MCKYNSRKGFTLIEILAVLAISAIIGTVIISLFISSIKSYNITNNENIIQDEGRMIVEFLENDMKIGIKKSVAKLDSNLGKTEIDGQIVSCNFAAGKSIEPIFACELNDNTGNKEIYVYIKVDKELIRGKVVSGAVGKEVKKLGTLTTNLISFSPIDTNPYKVKFTLGTTGSENEYNILITPRNN